MRRGPEFERAAVVHLDELVRVATRLTRSRSLAEDLVQETFLQAWRSFDRYEAGTNCRAWLYKILFHVMSQQRRRAGRQPNHVALEAAPASALGSSDAPADVLRTRRIQEAFDALAEPQRSVLLLADVEGFRYREIAEVLEIPVGTVMSRLSRARAHMRQALVSTRACGFPRAVNGSKGG